MQEYADAHPLDMPASARRMLLVACALVRKPDVLLLDEPTVGLDTAGYQWLARVMRDYVSHGDKAVLWTCHDAEFAAAVSESERLGEVDDLHERSAVDALRRRPRHRQQRRLRPAVLRRLRRAHAAARVEEGAAAVGGEPRRARRHPLR